MAQPRTTTDDAGTPRRGAAKRGAASPAAPPIAKDTATTAKTVAQLPTARPAPKARAKSKGPRRTTTPRPPVRSTPQAPDLAALREHLIATVRDHYPQADLEPIGAAFDLAVEAHAGQLRATGEPPARSTGRSREPSCRRPTRPQLPPRT